MQDPFRKLGEAAAHAVGTPAAFILALTIVFTWGISGRAQFASLAGKYAPLVNDDLADIQREIEARRNRNLPELAKQAAD